MARNSISTNQELFKGETLLSGNGQYKAVFQEDGNFVLYGWSKVWATNTGGSAPYRILLQSDRNLVMYTQQSSPVWSTGTYVTQPQLTMRLTVTNDGHLLLTSNGERVWSS
ncbi:mannose-specific lectin-like [Parambassis ranga]|uniref:Mannose-specific lectin-like n=1 Tax=Parambassis ranga TaxID=210632 RepID=A0A6P7I2F0_9TELE|nr:mannose-specific lectin-like [Parambassis ranga]